MIFFLYWCTFRVPVRVTVLSTWWPGVRRIRPWHHLVCRRGRVHVTAFFSVGFDPCRWRRGSCCPRFSVAGYYTDLVTNTPLCPPQHNLIVKIYCNSPTTKCSLQMREFIENDIRNWKLMSLLVWHNKRLALSMVISAEFRPSSTVVDVSIWVNMSWVQENLIQPSHQETNQQKVIKTVLRVYVQVTGKKIRSITQMESFAVSQVQESLWRVTDNTWFFLISVLRRIGNNSVIM